MMDVKFGGLYMNIMCVCIYIYMCIGKLGNSPQSFLLRLYSSTLPHEEVNYLNILLASLTTTITQLYSAMPDTRQNLLV